MPNVRPKKMKPIDTLRLLCLLLGLFALPLIAEEAGTAGKPALVWRDTETRRILFTSDDIISFDWEKQVFLLRTDAILDFLAWIPPHMHQARKLFVEDAKGMVYQAHWVSGASSMGFGGPVYKPLSPNPFFAIANGYPSRDKTTSTNNDVRFDARLHEGLKRAGVVQSIDLNRKYVGLAIQTTGHMWKDVGKDMKVRVEYFENTFRLGGKARAHIFFAGGEKTRRQVDSLAFEIKFVANEGTFRSDIRAEDIPVSDTEGGLYVCKFYPWKPSEGSGKHAELGTGVISLTIHFQKKDQEMNKTVFRLDFAESLVPIGGRIEAEQKNSPDNK